MRSRASSKSMDSLSRVGLDSDGAVTRRYLVRTIPTSLVIDGNGVIVARFQGPVTADALAQHIVSS